MFNEWSSDGNGLFELLFGFRVRFEIFQKYFHSGPSAPKLDLLLDAELEPK